MSRGSIPPGVAIFSLHMHHTKTIATIAETRAKLALEQSGCIVFTTTSDHSPVDIIAFDPVSNRTYKVQVKYRTNGLVPKFTAWSDRNGIHRKPIDTSLIDYFAMVQDDMVCFVPPSATGKTIRFTEPVSMTPYYWWEDFVLGNEELPAKRTICSSKLMRRVPHPAARKVNRPNEEELRELLKIHSYVSIGQMYGVSDNAVRKWAKSYSIPVQRRTTSS